MSTAEIVAEIPRLSHPERREIMRRLALERFQMLDALEAVSSIAGNGRQPTGHAGPTRNL